MTVTVNHLDLIIQAKERLAKDRPDLTRGQLIKLLAHKYLVCSEQKVYLARPGEIALSSQIVTNYEADIAKLLDNWPFAYVLGETDFFDETYKCKEGVLIPRPDSEVLVEECLRVLTDLATSVPQNTLNVCEIGVGSAALLAGIYSHFTVKDKQLRLFASDINPLAIKLSEENLLAKHVPANLWQVDLLPDLDTAKQVGLLPIDLLYSNPPYIAPAEWDDLDQSVKNFEPKNALLAEEEGLAVYRRILDKVRTEKYLRAGAYILFEHGYMQKASLANLLSEPAYSLFKIKKWRQDYHGKDRVLVIQYCP